MTFVEKNIVRQAVGNPSEVLYTVPTGITTIIKDIHICNNSNTDCYFSLWLVPNGQNFTNENVMFKEWIIGGNDFAHWNGYQILDTAGDRIIAMSQFSNQITVSISGAEIN